MEIRKTCKICNKKLGYRQRTYCSATCRNKFYNKKYSKQHTEWQRKKRDKEASISDIKKIKCEICGKYYRQVGTHIIQIHKISAREYRKQYGFDVKKGQLPNDLKKLKAKQIFENGTVNNLKTGKKFWFKKGSKTAGRYERSEQTMNRLKQLHKFNKR